MQSHSVRTMALSVALIVLAAGCTKSTDSASSGGGTAAPSADANVIALGNADAGHEIFRANCSICHGTTGTEGGVGPSLTREGMRKNYLQTVAWIENPQPPMPKLYPDPLSEANVRDVAAYVQKL